MVRIPTSATNENPPDSALYVIWVPGAQAGDPGRVITMDLATYQALVTTGPAGDLLRRVAAVEALTSEIFIDELPTWVGATAATAAVAVAPYVDGRPPGNDDVVAFSWAEQATVNTDDNVRLYMRLDGTLDQSSARILSVYNDQTTPIRSASFVKVFTQRQYDYYVHVTQAGGEQLQFIGFNRGTQLRMQTAGSLRHYRWGGDLTNATMRAAILQRNGILAEDGQLVSISGDHLEAIDAPPSSDDQARTGVASNLAAIQALQAGKLAIADAFTQALADARYERLGSGETHTPVAPEVVFFNNVTVGANANLNNLAVNTSATSTGTLVESVAATGLRLRAGAYLLHFKGTVDATGERFNPQLGVMAAGLGGLAMTSPVYYRGTTGETATSWEAALHLADATDLQFWVRQGQYSTAIGGIGGAGVLSELAMTIFPIGGIKGDPGAAAPEPAIAPYATVDMHPAGLATGAAPAQFWFRLSDKQTTRTLSGIAANIVGQQVTVSPLPDTDDYFAVALDSTQQANLTRSVQRGDSQKSIVLTLSFTDGTTYDEQLRLLVNNALFA